MIPFGVDDAKRVWVINDSQLFEELKEESKNKWSVCFNYLCFCQSGIHCSWISMEEVRERLLQRIGGMDDIVDLILERFKQDADPKPSRFDLCG